MGGDALGSARLLRVAPARRDTPKVTRCQTDFSLAGKTVPKLTLLGPRSARSQSERPIAKAADSRLTRREALD